jgi:HAE1 family hydrophobic/amphiphilic exporter-1
MNISQPFIKRPVMTTFISLALFLFGLMAYTRLPVSDMPPLRHPQITVMTHYSGASPEVVLQELTIPLEKELSVVKGVKEMTSTSLQDQSNITLEFDINKNMDEAIQDIVTAINKAEKVLPDDASKPTYFRRENDKEPISLVLLTSKTLNATDLRLCADTLLIPRLNRVEGIAQAMVFGSEKAFWLEINPELMAARHIGFGQLIDTVRAHTDQNALGTIQTGSKELSLEIRQNIRDAKKLENIYIEGSKVKIGDIANITEESANQQEFHFVTDGNVLATVGIALIKTSDANTVAISHDVKELLATVQKSLPPEITLKLWFDKAEWIAESILDVKWSLGFAFILVCLVIYMSLGRISDALIPSIALPLSLVGTFCCMYLLDYSVDLLSLLALTLSVGFVVDDAIVVLEAIVRFQEKGKKAYEASLMGSKQISFTVLSMTLSLVAVFIPLLFLPGVNGKLFREFSITLACAILLSGFVSLTLTPMLCSRFLRSHDRSFSESFWSRLYAKTLKSSLNYPKTILAAACILVAVTVPLYMRLPVMLVPPEDRGFLITGISLPSGLSDTEFTRYQSELEQLFMANPYVDSFFDFSHGEHFVFFTQLLPRDKRPGQQEIIPMLQKELDKQVGIVSFTSGFQLININAEFGATGQYRYDLYGLNAEEVERAALYVADAMRQTGICSYVDVSLKNDFPKLVLSVNDDLAHNFGFSKQHVQELIWNAFGKGSIGSLQQGDKNISICLRMQPEYADRASTLSLLHLNNDEGDIVPLKAIASWEETLQKPTITRKEQLPSVSIMFSLGEGQEASSALAKLQEIASKRLPANVDGALAGVAKKLASAMNETLFLFFAAAIVMYIILGILYESFIHPITILSSLPFAGLGGVITLALFNEPISIFSAVGFLLLLGIVKKNGIMMVDYALEAKSQGKSSYDAIIEGSLARFRPIMMTTLAAIMGAIPIAMGFGDGAEMRRGLGLVIVGGLLFSQLLTLYVTPLLFLVLDKRIRNKREMTA